MFKIVIPDTVFRKETMMPMAFLGEMTRFGIVGLLNTAITLLVIYVLHVWLNAAYLLANAVGFLVGFMNSFVMNRRWTFNSKGNVLQESILFVIIFLISYLIQVATLVVFKDYLQFSTVVSQILGMVSYTLTNFMGNRMVTFRKGIHGNAAGGNIP
ncbi:MAG: GtrA family protein [Pseudomonadota bacterium]